MPPPPPLTRPPRVLQRGYSGGSASLPVPRLHRGARGRRSSGAPTGPFPCDRCGRLYNLQRSLTRHRRLECGVAPLFQCPLCPVSLTRAFSLAKHVKTQHGTAHLAWKNVARARPARGRRRAAAAAAPPGWETGNVDDSDDDDAFSQHLVDHAGEPAGDVFEDGDIVCCGVQE